MESTITRDMVYKWLSSVTDPEVPVLTILDLVIVRDVLVNDKDVTVIITPTYSGCPAMDTIEADIKTAFKEIGIEANVLTVISPAWTTDWLTENGKQKLEAYGIAPPKTKGQSDIACPLCHSTNTKIISQFGSTACKALYRCNDCLEPFDYFKCYASVS